VIRVAPIPLYTTYQGIWQLVAALREIIDTGEHLKLGAAREAVA
jgi:kynureninase